MADDLDDEDGGGGAAYEETGLDAMGGFSARSAPGPGSCSTMLANAVVRAAWAELLQAITLEPARIRSFRPSPTLCKSRWPRPKPS